MTARVDEDVVQDVEQDGAESDLDAAVLAAVRVWQLIDSRLPGEECVP